MLRRMDMKSDPIREYERLKFLAEWYRGWAEVAGNAEERESRLKLAETVELKARALRDTIERHER